MVEQVVIHPVYEKVGSKKVSKHTVDIRVHLKDGVVTCTHSKKDCDAKYFPIIFEAPERLSRQTEVLVWKDEKGNSNEKTFLAAFPSKYPNEDVETLNIRIYIDPKLEKLIIHMD